MTFETNRNPPPLSPMPSKYTDYFWYRVARAAPSSRIRRCALDSISYVRVGTDVYLGPSVTITPFNGARYDRVLVDVRDRCAISPNVSFIASEHPENARLEESYGSVEKITVEEDCWVGAGATILNGTTVGRGSVVAAGSVVRGDVPPDSLVAGVPAVVKRELDQ